MDPPSQGAPVLEIESDRNPTGFGRFVREDPRRSTADRAALPTGVGGGAGVMMMERRPRCPRTTTPHGIDMIIARPVRDGWWYLFIAH